MKERMQSQPPGPLLAPHTMLFIYGRCQNSENQTVVDDTALKKQQIYRENRLWS